MLGSDLDHDAIIERLRGATPLRFKPVGTSSVVLQMTLEGPVDAVFRPRSRDSARGYLAEIAAYRVARLLGLSNAPPSVFRRVTRRQFRERLDPDFADTLQELITWTVWDRDDTLPGAVTYWVPQMRGLGLEGWRATERFTYRLTQGVEIPPEDLPLHTDISNMLVFDYLVGNWDRFSPGSPQGTPDGRRLFLRGQERAFLHPLPVHLHERLRSGLTRTEKFSRSIVDRLLRMRPDLLRSELRDTPDGPLLTERQLADLLDRREALLSYVTSLVENYGEEAVVCLP